MLPSVIRGHGALQRAHPDHVKRPERVAAAVQRAATLDSQTRRDQLLDAGELIARQSGGRQDSRSTQLVQVTRGLVWSFVSTGISGNLRKDSTLAVGSTWANIRASTYPWKRANCADASIAVRMCAAANAPAQTSGSLKQAASGGETGQFYQVGGAGLLHHAGTMHLDRPMADSQPARDLPCWHGRQPPAS